MLTLSAIEDQRGYQTNVFSKENVIPSLEKIALKIKLKVVDREEPDTVHLFICRLAAGRCPESASGYSARVEPAQENDFRKTTRHFAR